VAAASGTITVESGGDLEIESGGIIDVQTGAVVKNTTAGITAANRQEYITKQALTGVASTAGGVGNWQAPTGSDVIITGFYYDITAASATAGCVLDIGTTSTNATTKSDTLIDGLVATGSITGVKNHTKHAGTNGVGAQRLTAGKWITVTATGSKATGLAGNIYVKYTVV
jgi:hypothetical protein